MSARLAIMLKFFVYVSRFTESHSTMPNQFCDVSVVTVTRTCTLPFIDTIAWMGKRYKRLKNVPFASKVYVMRDSDEYQEGPQLVTELSGRMITKIVCGDKYNLALTCMSFSLIITATRHRKV